jgi:hypothetical protein
MTEKLEGHGLNESGASDIFPWLRATVVDLEGFDFEVPIAGSDAADCSSLTDLYRAASQTLSASDANETRATRLWDFLWGLTGLHFKPADINEPFGPMMVYSNGARSAILSDFSGHIDMLATMAVTTSNLVLKARLSDICWLLDRKRAALGTAAISSYLKILREIEAGELKFGFNVGDDRLRHETYEYLLRALGIGRTIGWNKPESLAARQMLIDIRKRAIEARVLLPTHWFSSLDLQFGVSDPGETASDLEVVLANRPAEASYHVVVDLWELAAKAYHRAKREEDKYRCQSEAAEQMVAQAKATTSAMLASELIANAIAKLHGVPNAKARRLALRHQLIDTQANISDEMSTFAQEIDLTELAEKIQEKLAPLSLFDSLFVFAVLDGSPEAADLEREAAENIREYPLSSIFGAAHLDDEGKVVHRTGGAGGLGEIDPAAIREQVAQAESIRRHVVALGKIEPARQITINKYYLSDDALAAVLQFSPFVPPDLVATFARGFARFFQGDYTSALYILTPLLENSLRHVLKSYGCDVTIFDNATQTQQDRTISSLYEQMRSELDKTFTRPITEDIERVFISKPGPYLRHAVAHGLLHDGSPYGSDAIYGCWLIFRLCLLPLFPHREHLGLK